MSLPSALKLFIDPRNNLAFGNFSGNSQISRPVFTLGDTAGIEIYLVESTQLNTYPRQELAFPVSPGIKVAVGEIDEAPTAGTWSMSYGGDTTAALAYNVTAAQLQTALNALASITSAGGVTVSKIGDNYNITFNQPGVRTEFTTNGSALVPLSTATVATLQAGTSSKPQISLVHLQRTVAGLATSFTQTEASQITILSLSAWDGIKATYRASISPDPKGGSFTLTFNPLAGTVVSTPSINVGAVALDVQNALNINSLLNNVTVTQVGAYDYDITVSTQPGNLGLTANGSGILSYNGFKGDISLNTAEAISLLDGADSIDTVLEVEITSNSKTLTLLQIPCVLKNAVIDAGSVEPLVLDTYLSQTTADGRYLRQSNNLSDITNVIQARTNLGVYSTSYVDTSLALKADATDLLSKANLSGATFSGNIVRNNGLGQTIISPSSVSFSQTGGGGSFMTYGSTGITFADSTVQTTAFLGSVSWGNVSGQLSNQSDLVTALDAKLSTSAAASTYYPLNSNPAGYVSITGDRYLTQSTSTIVVDQTNGKTLTVGTGLSYSPQQDCVISLNANPTGVHMHCTVVSYNSTTGAMAVNVNSHTGSGTYNTGWTVNVGGVTPQQSLAWGGITGTIANQTDLKNILDTKLGDAPSNGETYGRKNGAWSVITSSGGGMTSGGVLNVPNGEVYELQASDNGKHYIVTGTPNNLRAEIRFRDTLPINFSCNLTGWCAINFGTLGSAQYFSSGFKTFAYAGNTFKIFKLNGTQFAVDCTLLTDAPPVAGTVLFQGCVETSGTDAAGNYFSGAYVERVEVANGIGGSTYTDTQNAGGCYFPSGYVTSQNYLTGLIENISSPDGYNQGVYFQYTYAEQIVANGSGGTYSQTAYVSPEYGAWIGQVSSYTARYNGNGGYYLE
ncbi:hypothetical protein UFOVP779_40 [uncultured Caudovirales phage]|uniref:Tail fiber protein n=1 Tax=uncultured Caudovirales phage TaxID=2100421 RepID=A0A6J5NZS6_9CAUD|nr:hypothetical protein UFOVP779_40 [uncultured Caudovirales phage]